MNRVFYTACGCRRPDLVHEDGCRLTAARPVVERPCLGCGVELEQPWWDYCDRCVLQAASA